MTVPPADFVIGKREDQPGNCMGFVSRPLFQEALAWESNPRSEVRGLKAVGSGATPMNIDVRAEERERRRERAREGLFWKLVGAEPRKGAGQMVASIW